MRIGFDAKRAFLNNRGLGNYARTLITNFSKNYPQHQIELFTTSNSKSLFEGSNCYNIHLPQGLWKKAPMLWRSFFLGKTHSLNLDVFHGLSNEVPFGFKKNNPHTKLVVTIHDLLYKRQKSDFSIIDRQIYDYKVRYACKNSDSIIATSEQTKKDLIDFLNIDEGKIKVLYQGASECFYKNYNEDQLQQIRLKYGLPQKYFLAVGALVPYKNFSTLIKALSQLPEDLRIPLVFVGKGKKHLIELQNLSKLCKIDKYIHFVENCEHQDLPLFYLGAEALLLPSLFEGFGIPLIEAGLMGRQMVVGRWSCFPEVAGKHAIYVQDNDILQWVKAMKQALAGNYKSTEIKQDFYQRFAPQVLSEKLLAIYTSN